MKTGRGLEFQQFFTPYPRRPMAKGEKLLRPKQNPGSAYYLSRGLVRQYVVSPRGEILMVHIYKPGSLFPLPWIINNTPNTFYFDALTALEVNLVPKPEARRLLRQYPELLYHYTSRLLAGISGLVTRIAYLMLDNASTKVALLLFYFAKTFGEKQADGTVIPIALTHRDIAAWVGVTRETASLRVEALKRKGIVAYRGRTLIVKDLKQLQGEAGV